MVRCRFCGHKISLRNKKEHFNRIHFDCDTEVVKTRRLYERIMRDNLSEEACIDAAIAAKRIGVSLTIYLAIKHVTSNDKKVKPSTYKNNPSKFKFVNRTSSKTKPWRAEVEVRPHEWIIDLRCETEEEAIEAIVKATGLKRECLLLLKNYRLSAAEKELMFLN